MRKTRTLTLLAIGLTLAGCASTHIVSSWKEPGATAVAMRRVLVISPSKDETMRRTAEDELVKRLSPSIDAVPSYTLLGKAQLEDREQVRQLVRAQGFDGVVLFRVVNVERQATWTPGMYVGPSFAYGGWGYYDPGYVDIDTVVRVETNVYSVAEDKLVWAAASDTIDPSSVKSLVRDVASAVSKEMRKQGFVL